MPPKKKKEKGLTVGKPKLKEKRRKKDNSTEKENEIDSLRQSLRKVEAEKEALIKELEFRNDTISRFKAKCCTQQVAINDMEKALELRSQDRVDLTSDMSRQYKALQVEMIEKVNDLEEQVIEYKKKQEWAEKSLEEKMNLFQSKLAEKDAIIEEQNIKHAYMSTEFENMLQETVAKMTKKLESLNTRWTEQIELTDISQKRLGDFHFANFMM